jgi:hypothetical protein
MVRREIAPALVALATLTAAAGCGSSSSHPASSGHAQSALGGPASRQLIGTFTTTLTPRDRTAAPKPAELPTGPWTLVIGNNGGPNNSRALGLGNGDTNRVVYRFGVTGATLILGCTDQDGLPTGGSEKYAWSLRGRALTLKPASAACKHGDANNQLILTSHPWTKQGAH